MPETHPLQPTDPRTLGEYRLLGRLGKGAQGIVFEGESPDGRRVAIKLLNTRLDKPGLDSERFLREVAAARRVAQFCTAQVLGAHMDGEHPYIVSELVDGISLQAVVQRDGPRTGGALYRLAVGTVTALAAIHRAGIVHRDFKPSNVLLGPDGPRVIDFGIARALDSAMTISSGVVGTPAYMSPEQISAERVGPASDMFSWGLTMVFAATGRPAFGQDSLPAVVYRVMHEEPDLSALPETLRPIVRSCLRKRADERPAAADVLFALLANEGEPPRPEDALNTGSQLAAEQTPPDPPAPAAGWANPSGPAASAPPGGYGWANPSGEAYAPPQGPATPYVPPQQGGGPRWGGAPGHGGVSGQGGGPQHGGAARGVPYVPRQQPPSGPSQVPPPYPMNATPRPSIPGPVEPGPEGVAGGEGPPGRAPSVPGQGQGQGQGRQGRGQEQAPTSQQAPSRQSPSQKPPAVGEAGGRGDNDAFFKHAPIEERPDEVNARRRRAAMVSGTLVVALALAGSVLYFGPKMFGAGEPTGGKAAQTTTSASAAPAQTQALTQAETPIPTPTPSQITPTPTPTRKVVPVLGKQDGKSFKGHTKGVQTISAISAGGKTWLVTGGQDGRVRLWDLARHKSLATMKGHSEEVYAVACVMVGKTPMAVSGGYDGSVRLWNLKTHKGKVLGWHGDAVYAVAVTKVKGKYVAVTGDADGYLRFWDLKKRKSTGKIIRAHRKPVNWLSATHLGDRAVAVSASEDETVRMWDMARRKAYGKAYKGHSRGVYSVAVGKVGGKTVVASGGKDGKIRIWDAKSRKTVATLSGHKKIVYSLSFGTLDGRTVLLSGSTDGTIRLWDPETRKTLGKPVKAHKKGVYAVGIVPLDGNAAIVSAGKDKVVRLWKIASSS
ncbi:protein kinase [Nonomuraea angiospora]|uniref:WD40 repeat protein/tRNA A-37 threonylcarbamoyl transferase component Bud32 n=1 Tax=Nonomuraea angiospora TaxID=46172 RepID=A0ABR9M8Y1_9ACTN|nr:serine/threonine-protein kinase [Nonomuraea angiospora]MBE1589381.1 WD40 repeat protein/tRNA A-37 threonylcarbamoyl transferase component Bud32 [Nonomuraea angiospora]